MMLWGFDIPNELWVSDAALGDAGASCLGFYGGAFNPSGDKLIAHGFTGGLHLWQQQQAAADRSSGSSGRLLWVPQHALGGHYGAVHDLAWGADGACLQTVAADQTARLFTGVKGHWFELARTQVGGGAPVFILYADAVLKQHGPAFEQNMKGTEQGVA
jgi:elongator complex protein 2